MNGVNSIQVSMFVLFQACILHFLLTLPGLDNGNGMMFCKLTQSIELLNFGMVLSASNVRAVCSGRSRLFET